MRAAKGAVTKLAHKERKAMRADLKQVVGIVLCLVLSVGAIQLVLSRSATDVLRLDSGQVIVIERVSTPEKRSLGLSGRNSLAKGKGMLFEFETSDNHCFWMKDTRFPLDMIWLNDQKQVVHIERHVQPESYPKNFCPVLPAKYVLEVNADEPKIRGISLSTRADF